MVMMHELEENVYTDVDCHLVRDEVLSLLDSHLTNVDVSNTSEENNTDVSINAIDNTNLPDFSIVNAHQDSDCSSGSSSYDTDEEFTLKREFVLTYLRSKGLIHVHKLYKSQMI